MQNNKCRLNQCCCCCSIDSGITTIGVVHIIFAIINLLAFILQLMGSANGIWFISFLCLILVWLPKSIAFIYLSFDRNNLKRRWRYLYANFITCIMYVVVAIINTILEVILIKNLADDLESKNYTVLNEQDTVSTNVAANIIWIVIYICFATWILLVIRSYCLQLMDLLNAKNQQNEVNQQVAYVQQQIPSVIQGQQVYKNINQNDQSQQNIIFMTHQQYAMLQQNVNQQPRQQMYVGQDQYNQNQYLPQQMYVGQQYNQNQQIPEQKQVDQDQYNQNQQIPEQKQVDQDQQNLEQNKQDQI